MRERIALAPLLRETVSPSYSDLVTRPTGVSLRSRIEAMIAASPHPTAQLDFSSIGLLDMSCADEIVAKLILGVSDDRPRYFVLLNVSDCHQDAIEHVLENHRLTVIAMLDQAETPCILGWRTPDLTAAFGTVVSLGPGDAGRVADALGWTVERAADALQSLALRRLVQAASGTYCPVPVQ